MSEIGIFHSRGDKHEVFAKISVNFRNKIHHFSNGKNLNAFAVWMAIALHADQDGWAWPSRKLLMKETGLKSNNTIATVLRFLAKLEINGKRVLEVYNAREYTSKKFRHNVYLLFPDAKPYRPCPLEDLLEISVANAVEGEGEQENEKESEKESEETADPCINDPCIDDPYTGDRTRSRDSLKEQETTLSLEKVENVTESVTPWEQIMGEDEDGNPLEVKNTGALQAVRKYHEDTATDEHDYSNFHEEVRPIIRAFCETFGLNPPLPRRGSRGRNFFAEWEEEAQQLRQMIRGHNINIVMQGVRERYDVYLQDKNQRGGWMIASPGSIIKVATDVAHKQTEEATRPKQTRIVWMGGERHEVSA
jgi:hypothetical protein